MIDVDVSSNAGVGKTNEDFVLHTTIAKDKTLVVVCDGMGGLSNAALASQTIAAKIECYITQHHATDSSEELVLNAISFANKELAKECILLKAKMGASIALTLFEGNCCYYTWLGDVRIYLYHNDCCEQLTTDHLAIDGNHKYITRCINGREFRKPLEVHSIILSDSDKVVIATDGYYMHNDIDCLEKDRVLKDDDSTIVKIRCVF